MKKLRIIDIAKMANVSAGTVDRVIHNRGLVAEDKRKRIEKILKENNYKPNMVARFLASKKDIRFAMVIPAFKHGDYWDLVQMGAEKAADELSDFNISVDYLYFDQFNNNSFKELISKLEDEEYDGIVIATLHKEEVKILSQILDKKDQAYVFIDSNIPQCNNLSYYGTDSYATGAIAAKLVLTNIDKDEPVFIAYSSRENSVITTQIENRKSGFLKYLEQNKYKGVIEEIVLDTSSKGNKFLSQLSGLNQNVGIVTFNSRIYEVVDLIKQLQLDFSKIHLVGYDPIEKNLDALGRDDIRYLISQRSVQQGYESVKSLSNYIIFGSKPDKENYMPIDILMKENMPFYQD